MVRWSTAFTSDVPDQRGRRQFKPDDAAKEGDRGYRPWLVLEHASSCDRWSRVYRVKLRALCP